LCAYYERYLGVATSGSARLEELGLDPSLGSEYAPTEYTTLHALMRACRVRRNHDVLLDVGSGKGRALIVAGRYPFRRVIGIDVSEELSNVARQNVNRARPRLRCADVTMLTRDATRYEVPDDVTIVYFNYSFDGDIFVHFLNRIRQSLAANPRPFRLITNVPALRETGIDSAIARAGWLSRDDRASLLVDRVKNRKITFHVSTLQG
jgi:SAM-dependent methyltransferase